MALTDLMGDIQRAEIKYIDIDRIETNPLNDAPIIQVDELAESILTVGLKEPLNVYRRGSGYVLDGGERRYTAIRDYIFKKGLSFSYAGKECEDVVPAVIIPRPADELAEYESIAADNDRRQFDKEDDFLEFVSAVMDRYEYFAKKGMKPKGEKREWIGKIIGKKGRTASNWISRVEEKRNGQAESYGGEETKKEEMKKKEEDIGKKVLKLFKSCKKIKDLADDQDMFQIAQKLERACRSLNMALTELDIYTDAEEK